MFLTQALLPQQFVHRAKNSPSAVTDVCLLKHLRAEPWEGGHFPCSLSEVRHKEGLALALLILEHQPASAAHGGETINLQL